MNYCIYNGVNSNTILGLLICELPPITRPRMRYEAIEIDGRDGNIADELGYSAFIKEMIIGIYGNYSNNTESNRNKTNLNRNLNNFDIDAISKYLSGSGKITFSNEPDKYYNVNFLDQIDFERLVKFRTAKVKMMAQPFKFLKDEPVVDVTTDSDSQTKDNLNDKTSLTSIIVTNQGLEKSKPLMTLYGTEIVEVLINGLSIFRLDFGTEPNNSDNPDNSNKSSNFNEYLTVDSEIEDCYKDTTPNLKNRSMTGVFPILDPGENQITWTGNLTRIVIEPRSRWL
jgi:predicted phage tail component-like protein